MIWAKLFTSNNLKLNPVKHRFFKIGYILLALAITGIASVEIWHRVENTENKRDIRAFQFENTQRLAQFGMGRFRSGSSALVAGLNAASNGGMIDDIRGNYLKYPLGLLILSGVFFVGGYLVGGASDEKKV